MARREAKKIGRRLAAGLVAACLILALCGQALAVDVQAHRKKTIGVIIQMGYLAKVEIKDGLPHMFVTPRFMADTFYNQQGVAALIWHYYKDMDPKYDKVILIFTGTGAKVGVFSKAVGGLRMGP